MKKIIIFISFMALAINSFAFTLKHKYESNGSNASKLADDVENFSGRWVGNCMDEYVQLMIKQDKNQVTLGFKDESLTLDLDGISTESKSLTSSKDSSIKHATIQKNELYFLYSGIWNSSPHTTIAFIFLILTKDGDTLTIKDKANDEICVLQKDA